MERSQRPTSLLIAGVDEVGRGCLAGPVYAAAVILPGAHGLAGLDDSKRLSETARNALFEPIRGRALAWAVGVASVAEIDRLNILQASLLAMRRAVEALQLSPGLCLVDGNQLPLLSCKAQAVIGGDALHPPIMAASILAKVSRDREMHRLDAEYPGYGLGRHKGYGTAAHLAALRRLGPSPVHRTSFAPCRTAAVSRPESGGVESLAASAASRRRPQ